MYPSSAALYGFLELLFVIRNQLCLLGHGIVGVFQLVTHDDVNSTARSHYGDFRGRRGQVHVRTKMFRPHHAVSTAVAFAK